MRFTDNLLKYRRILIVLLFAVYFAVAYAVMGYFDITCVFLELFGLPCPGCGMTRALLSVLRLDFLMAARYNVVIFFMPYVFLYILCDFKKRYHKYLLAAVGVIAAINWAVKLYVYFSGGNTYVL